MSACKVAIPNARIYLSKSTCIYENLAFEEWLFRNHNLNQDGEALLIWSNEPSVVIGRHQNPWLEVDTNYLHEKGINLVRRHSGGGTVYHDLGNINISFLTTQKRHCRPRNLANVSSWINGHFNTRRDDLLLQPGDRKISGTAARIAHGKAYHHLTLLVKPDLPILRRVLQSPFVGKIETNATRSVRAKAVGQLIDVVPGLEINNIVDVLVDGFQQLADHTDVIQLDSKGISDETKWNGVKKKRIELQSPEWDFCQVSEVQNSATKFYGSVRRCCCRKWPCY
ncbi:BPL/LPL catalytic domain-containing protein [Aphelenchoides bicaudatus]|nr:BPL/LPL catalytic domain-containing protein [Aphelenchoides bicaudatus]